MANKTIIWNQLIKNGDFTSKSYWSIVQVVSWTVSNNEAIIVANGLQSYAYFHQNISTSLLMTNHKYLISLDATVLDGSDTTFSVAMHNGANVQDIVQTVPLSSGINNIHVDNIWTANSNYIDTMTSSARLIMYLPHSGGLGKVGYTTKVRNVQMFDLTLMFGEGNEPATEEEFWSHFERKVYPYNTGMEQSLFTIGRKNKIYTGKSIIWNQLVDKSWNYPTSGARPNGVTFTKLSDGSVHAVGMIGSLVDYVSVYFTNTLHVASNHIYFSRDCSPQAFDHTIISSNAFCKIWRANEDTDTGRLFQAYSPTGRMVDAILRPQLYDLTLMFGSGNEPNTVAAFYQYFDDIFYDYNTGTEQPLFTIGRKNKIYTGKNITWNQIADFGTLYGRGQYSDFSAYFKTTDKIIKGHKYFISSDNVVLTGGTGNLSCYYRNENNVPTTWIRSKELPIAEAPANMSGGVGQTGDHFWLYASRTYSASNILLCDLTLMFGAGNEPTTPEEFWSHFERKHYPYNTGTQQPLFTIGRKSKIGG